MTNDPFKNFKPLNSKPAPKQSPKNTNNNSFVESMRDMGGSVMKSLKNDVVKGTAQSIFDQLLGSAQTGRMPTTPDQAINPDLDKYIAEKESAAAEQAKMQERAFHVHKAQETKVLFSYADESLKKEIDGVRGELQMLVASMGQVEKQIEMAMMDNIVDGGVYHLNYFHKLKEWIRFMRKSLEDSSAWLQMSGGRKSKGYFWTQEAKSGSMYSQSSERNVQMGAG
ncbi:MAG: DUF5660 family protein [Candidatus Paceibacterota bacterium]|jgi:hypothetical protein